MVRSAIEMLDKTETADQLVAEYLERRDYMARETKRFSEFLAPHKARQDEIGLKLMEIMNQQGTNSMKTDKGTAYKSIIVTPKIIDREQYLDFVMDKYDTVGAGMLQLGSPKKEAIDEFMQANNGALPPGVETSSFVHVNVRKT